MSRPTGGRSDTSADRRLAVGLALALGLLFLALVTYKPERAEAIDSRAQADATLTRLRQLREQMDDLATRLEEDRRALESRQRAVDKARAAGTPTWAVERAWNEAHESGLDPEMVLQLITVESDWDADLIHTNADGSKDFGLMQINERTWPGLAQALHLDNPLDPSQNIRAGIYHLAGLARRYGGDMDRALTAYNRGAEGLRQYVASRGTARSAYSEAVLRKGE